MTQAAGLTKLADELAEIPACDREWQRDHRRKVAADYRRASATRRERESLEARLRQVRAEWSKGRAQHERSDEKIAEEYWAQECAVLAALNELGEKVEGAGGRRAPRPEDQLPTLRRNMRRRAL